MGTVAEKTDYLTETKRLIAEAIRKKGIEVADDLPFRDYEELIRSLTVIEKDYLSYLGTSFTATNTLNGTTKGLEIRGKTYQNLYPTTDITTRTSTTAIVKTNLSSDISMFKPSTDYTIIINVISNTLDSNMDVFRYDTTGNNRLFMIDNNTIPIGGTGFYRVLTTTSDDLSEVDTLGIVHMSAYVEASGTAEFIIQILEGDYTTTDLPDTIDGIESVSGDVVVKSVGANLVRLDLDRGELFSSFSSTNTFENGLITMTSDSVQKYAFYNYNFNLYKPNTTYTIVLNIVEDTSNAILVITNTFDSIFSSITSITSDARNIGITKFVVSTIDDLSAVNQVARMQLQTTTNPEGSITYSFMILEGDYTDADITADNWDDYAYQESTTDFGNFEGMSIGEYYDYRTLTDDVQVINSVTFDGSENWVYNGSGDSDNDFLFYHRLNDSMASVPICNELKVLVLTDITSASVDGGAISYNINNDAIYIKYQVTTVDELEAKLESNPVTIYYALATPISTPLDTPLTELDAYNTSTTVSVETDSNIEVEAYMQIPTDDVGLEEYQDAVDGLTELGVTPSEYHNENMDALSELGVTI